jgi:SAM-dependent methyltransferase
MRAAIHLIAMPAARQARQLPRGARTDTKGTHPRASARKPNMSGIEQRQSWDPDRYAKNARYVSDYGAPVLALLALRAGERVLDLGCGDGALTTQIAAAGAEVIGVDASAEMVAAARRRGLDARVMNGDMLSFAREFDAVFSNAALHWMREPDTVIAGVARALKPRGRFVGEFGGHGCVAAITVALVAVLARRGIDGAAAIPWYFPTVDDYRARLERGGFAAGYIELIPRPTPLPQGMAGFLETFAESFFRPLAPGERDAARAEVIELLRPVLCDDQGRWTADYIRIRFAATLER